jgi:hypothetical protein
MRALKQQEISAPVEKLPTQADCSNKRSKLLRLVAKNAATRLSAPPALDRAHLLDGMALILPPHEAALARHTTALIRQAKDRQTGFEEILKGDK